METTREREAKVLAGAPARREKFRGVTYLPSGKYSAGIYKPKAHKRTWLGTFTDERVAACAYDLAARSLRGTKAKTNFCYPPPDGLIAALRTDPGRRGHVYLVMPPPAPSPAGAPPAAPAPVRFADDFSYKAPPGEPAQFPAYPILRDLRPAKARLGQDVSALAPEPDAKITLVRSIPPKPFSMPAAVAASRLVSDPVDLIGPRIHMMVSAREPVPVSSVETCFSTTDPELMDSASSSRQMPMAFNSRRLMLKTPKIFAIPKTVRTPSEDGFTGDNYTGINVPLYFNLPRSALMPVDISSPEAPEGDVGCPP